MSKKVKEEEKGKEEKIPVQEGSRFEGLSGIELQREIQKQMEEKRIAREKRREEARKKAVAGRMPPMDLTNGPLKKKTFHASMGQGRGVV